MYSQYMGGLKQSEMKTALQEIANTRECQNATTNVYRPGGLSSKFHNQLLARDSAAIWCSGFQPDSLSEDPDFRRAMELYFMEMLGLQVNWGF